MRQHPAEEVASALRSAATLVLTTHIRPDGDAIGATLALYHALRRHTKADVRMMLSDTVPISLQWLPGAALVEQFTGNKDQMRFLQGCDGLVVLDANAKQRIGTIGTYIDGLTCPTILIDHHTNPESWFDIAWVDDEAASTAELIAALIPPLAQEAPSVYAAPFADIYATKEATCIYAGLVSDTGSFRFPAVKPPLHRLAANLLDSGIEHASIHQRLYDVRTLGVLQLLGRLYESINVTAGGKLALGCITSQQMYDHHVDTSETGGFVNELLSLQGVDVAILLMEISKGVKLSFRSKNEVFVHTWAQSLGGGGHIYAAGAFMADVNAEEAMERILASAPAFLPTSWFTSGS